MQEKEKEMMGVVERGGAIFFGLGRLARNNWLSKIVTGTVVIVCCGFFPLSSSVYCSTEDEHKDRVGNNGSTGQAQNDHRRCFQ